MFEELAVVPRDADEAALVARLMELETAKATAAAGQAKVTAELDRLRRVAETAAGIPAHKQGRGLASEVALARRDSPHRGGRHLGFARALVHEMPHTLHALEHGALNEWRATLIVRESACLSVDDRRTLDAELCADPRHLTGKGDARITADAKRIAYRLDPRAVVDRATKAPAQRCVTIRPAPDTMTYVTALLPVAQGVAVYAALTRTADTTFDDRGHNQVMADTLVERVTGQPATDPVAVTVDLVMTDQTLLAGDDEPAHLHRHGPIPAEIARRMVADAATVATIRRLYTHPTTGALVAMESRARRFPKALAHFIDLRDQTCRTPYCDAPVRHHDHAVAHHRRGPTTAANGLGTCAHCNYTKEAPGWYVTTDATHGTHTATITTPTGHTHHSAAPPPPGRQPRPVTMKRAA